MPIPSPHVLDPIHPRCLEPSKSPTCLSLLHLSKKITPGFPGGAVVENLPANAGDMGSRPGLGRSHMPRSN